MASTLRVVEICSSCHLNSSSTRVTGKPLIGLELPVPGSNNEARVESYKAFIEKASQPKDKDTDKHLMLPSSKVQGTGL